MAKPFTKEMKKDFTILVPNMAPVHFLFLQTVFTNHGYKTLILDNCGNDIIQLGLKYVHNDMCYPALLVIGQIIDAIEKKLVDPEKCAVAISQTGGGCRASNYYFLLKKAMEKAGYKDIPIISLNLAGMNKNPGFKIGLFMIVQAAAAVFYGDIIMCLSNQTRPYEVVKGETDRVIDKWVKIIGDKFRRNKGYFWKNLKTNFDAIASDFASIKTTGEKKVKVGVVGEIYMKFSKIGNSNLQQFLEDEGCEVMIPPLMGFVLYCFHNQIDDEKYYGGRFWRSFLIRHFVFPYMEKVESWMDEAIVHYGFKRPATFDELLKYSTDFIDTGCKMGEGWLLTAEMVELIEKGYENIVCTQPFGCLPNHIVGKGMIRPLKEKYPDSNVVPIDYDPSATKVNQENRIKLMLAVAKERL